MSGDNIDFIADYRLLGLDPGCGIEAVRQAYRRAVLRVHPDRAGSDDSDASGDAMVAVNLAYARLTGFHSNYGRLPLEAAPRRDPVAAVRDPAPIQGHTRGRFSTATILLLAIAGAGMAGMAFQHTDPTERATALPAQLPSVATSRTEQPADDDVGRDPVAAATEGIRIGDSAARVRRILGPPILVERDLWEYGPSHVRFERGRVVGWYSSPMKPLQINRQATAGEEVEPTR